MLTSGPLYRAIPSDRSIAPALLLLALLLGACQTAVEPEDIQISDVVVSVRVVDQGGKGIAGVEVRYAADSMATVLAPFGSGRTAEDGTVSQIFTIPASGSRFTFEIAPGDVVPGAPARRLDSVFIPCKDYVMEVEIPREQTVVCGEQLPDEDLSTSICIDTRSADTICTALLDPLCTRPMVISAAPDLGAIPGATLLLRVDGTPRTGSSVTLQTGERCEICMVYRAQQQKSSGSQRVAVTGTPNGQPPYRLLDVDFSAESKCDSCSCPAAVTLAYPAVDADTICVGETSDISINLARVVNSNERCDLVFSLEKGPQNPALRISSFNGGENDLAPGSSLGRLRLQARPTVAGAITEQIVYAMRTRGRDGTLSECGKLTINVRIQAVAPGCPLTLTGTLIDRSGPGRTLPISQNVCDSGTGSARTICIENPSQLCALTLTDGILRGGDRSQFELDGAGRFPIEIPPGGRECIEVRFLPTREYYLASGNPPRSKFTTELTISTICGDSILPITGIIPDPKIPPMRLFPTDCSVNPNTGIRTQSDGSIVTDQLVGGNFLVTIQSITISPGGNSAVLDIRTPYKLLRSGLTDVTPLCDLRFDPAARAACGSLGSAGLQTVREGEVYIFNYNYQGCDFCALLWVESIDPVSVTRSCPQVQFRICSPLVF
jgi:hypothetical protein